MYTCVASSRSGKATWSAVLKLDSRTNPNAHFFRSPEPTSLPGPPSRPLVVNSTHNSITISWSRNNKIGSSSLLGYQVVNNCFVGFTLQSKIIKIFLALLSSSISYKNFKLKILPLTLFIAVQAYLYNNKNIYIESSWKNQFLNLIS